MKPKESKKLDLAAACAFKAAPGRRKPGPSAPVVLPIVGLRDDPNDMVGTIILNTGPFRANGRLRQDVFVNVHRQYMRIKRCRVWLGANVGGKCDAHCEIFRNDAATIAIGNFDHYADGPQGGACEVTSHDPYLLIAPEEQIIVNSMVVPITPGMIAHWIVWLWWQWGKG